MRKGPPGHCVNNGTAGTTGERRDIDFSQQVMLNSILRCNGSLHTGQYAIGNGEEGLFRAEQEFRTLEFILSLKKCNLIDTQVTLQTLITSFRTSENAYTGMEQMILNGYTKVSIPVSSGPFSCIT